MQPACHSRPYIAYGQWTWKHYVEKFGKAISTAATTGITLLYVVIANLLVLLPVCVVGLVGLIWLGPTVIIAVDPKYLRTWHENWEMFFTNGLIGVYLSYLCVFILAIPLWICSAFLRRLIQVTTANIFSYLDKLIWITVFLFLLKFFLLFNMTPYNPPYEDVRSGINFVFKYLILVTVWNLVVQGIEFLHNCMNGKMLVNKKSNALSPERQLVRVVCVSRYVAIK